MCGFGNYNCILQSTVVWHRGKTTDFGVILLFEFWMLLISVMTEKWPNCTSVPSFVKKNLTAYFMGLLKHDVQFNSAQYVLVSVPSHKTDRKIRCVKNKMVTCIVEFCLLQ